MTETYINPEGHGVTTGNVSSIPHEYKNIAVTGNYVPAEQPTANYRLAYSKATGVLKLQRLWTWQDGTGHGSTWQEVETFDLDVP